LDLFRDDFDVICAPVEYREEIGNTSIDDTARRARPVQSAPFAIGGWRRYFRRLRAA